jgi:hypothetical protein
MALRGMWRTMGGYRERLRARRPTVDSGDGGGGFGWSGLGGLRRVVEQCFDRIAQPVGQFFDLAHCHAARLDGLADCQGELARIEVVRVDGQQIVCAADGDGHERNLRADGEIRGAGEERLELACDGAPAFRKYKERHAGAQSLDGATQTRKRGVGIFSVDWHLPRALQEPADEWPFPQRFLGQNAELKGQRGKDDGRVHVGGVVGGVNGDRMFAKILATTNLEPAPRCAKAAARPYTGDAMLHSAAFFY